MWAAKKANECEDDTDSEQDNTTNWVPLVVSTLYDLRWDATGVLVMVAGVHW